MTIYGIRLITHLVIHTFYPFFFAAIISEHFYNGLFIITLIQSFFQSDIYEEDKNPFYFPPQTPLYL